MGALSKQIAVVTGAGSGIGRAIAMGIAQHGGHVMLLGRDMTKLAETQRRIAINASGSSQSYVCDLGSADGVVETARTLEMDHGKIDILVHSAGIVASDPTTTPFADTFDLQYSVNVRAPYILTRALVPSLQARKGQLVFINSSVCLQPAKVSFAAYTASKMALKAVADSFRAEFNTAGIRVLTVYPGSTASPMQASLHQAEGKAYYPDRLLQPEDVAQLVLAALLTARTAEVMDIVVRPMQKI